MLYLVLLGLVGFGLMASYIVHLKLRVSGYLFNEKNLTDALNRVDAAIYMKDRRGRYIYANRALLRLRGIDSASLYGKADAGEPTRAGADTISQSDGLVLERGETAREEVQVGEGENQTVFLESKYPLIDRRGHIVGLVGISTDVTELFRLRRELEQAARTDELTGALNRRAFFDFAELNLAGARRHGRPLAMLIVDVDHFKRINDRFGHPVGDRVLKDIASRAISAIRDVDRLARLGGEEFAVLLPETDLEHAIEVANRIRSALQPLSLQNGVQIKPTVSIGVASLHPEDQSIHELYQRADIALYRAKTEGRDQVIAESLG
jgi:diguanylate cyclase (GGDEF)-like protein/PAS domain S-box-containing protein